MAIKRTNLGGSGSGGGVTDHGALTGLGDNDHPQYAMAEDVTPVVFLTQAEYDALTPSAGTLYVVTD